ncbi:MAG: hypothetical protein AVDCRST_MAG93-3043, partial [uncultured Chloroflexia bacterium]
ARQPTRYRNYPHRRRKLAPGLCPGAPSRAPSERALDQGQNRLHPAPGLRLATGELLPGPQPARRRPRRVRRHRPTSAHGA